MNEEFPIHWLQEIADKILARNDEIITLSTGKTPSGHIHVGILREIIICDSLRRIFEKKGEHVRFYLFLDSLDAAKRFPKYIDENFQKQVISRVLSFKKSSEQIISINPFLSDLNTSTPIDVIEKNKSKILKYYNKEVYRNNLLRVYKNVTKYEVVQHIDKTKLFFLFLNPERLNLLKWSSYVE